VESGGMGKRIISWASPLPQTLQRTLVPGAAELNIKPINRVYMEIYPSIEQFNIEFGLKREKVRDILGEPSSTCIIKVSDNADLDCWTYDLQKIELIFDSENFYSLSTISFSSKNMTVDGVAVIGLKEKKLLKTFPDLYCTDEKDEIGYNYNYPGENLMFWVSDGVVQLLTLYA
jgi:hypothetical protein